MEEYITNRMLARQAWKYYFLAFAWPAYLFVLPFVLTRSHIAIIALALLTGIYLYVWLACLMHECWHRYVRQVPNNIFYRIFSYMLTADPQIYKAVHGLHHLRPNTWEDIELHPLGKIENVWLRKLYNLAEIVFGVLFTFGLLMYVLPRHEKFKSKYKIWKLSISVGIVLAFYGTIGVLSAVVFDLSATAVVTAYLLAVWLGAAAIHHDQLLEHGNITIEGDLHTLNMATRNIKPPKLLDRAFLFMMHQDPREHVLHHTMGKFNSRPFPQTLAMPADALYISMGEYAKVLWNMVAKG